MKWPLVEIRNVAEVVSGFGFPREFQGTIGEVFPFFKVGDMNTAGNEHCMTVAANSISSDTLRKLKAKTFPKGTIIFPKIGAAIATNKKRMLVRPSVVDNNVMGLIPNELVNEWYLFYWMQQFDLRSISNIGPVPSIRKTEFEKIVLPLPAPSEQRRIVRLLREADDLRDKHAQGYSKASRVLFALFRDKFGDPAANPFGWPMSDFGQAVLETQYGTSEKTNESGYGIAVIRMNNIDASGYLDLTNLKYAPLPPEEVRSLLLQKGDILFNRTNSRELVGKTGLWSGEINAVPASYLIRVRVDQSRVTPEYVWAYLNTPFMKQTLFARARRAIGMANINAEEIRALPFMLPPKDLQVAFVDQVEVVNQIRNRLFDQKARLDSLFSILLRRAFSGDLTAKWREANTNELLTEMEKQARILNSQTTALLC